ncbi:MAG: DUF1109 domain-containing protein [Hydrogenophilales bacterium]|nr:DUF1109 domain-containing protein [Hydrogenophilales bacterium]
MKTDDLVMLLATGECAVPEHAAQRRYAVVLALGMAAAGVLMLGLLGVRHDLAEAMRQPMFWAKCIFAAVLLLASLLAVLRLSRPGASLDRVPFALSAPVLAMWGLATVVLAGAAPEQRLGMLLGSTWDVCPFLIALLSTPTFVASLWTMRSLAPTRLSLAGAAAGLLSGSVGALVYCLHCPEMGAPFIGMWYLLGILIPAAAGALLGRYVLRW